MEVGYRCRLGRNEHGGECVSHAEALVLKKRELEWMGRRESEKLVVEGGGGACSGWCALGHRRLLVIVWVVEKTMLKISFRKWKKCQPQSLCVRLQWKASIEHSTNW